MPIEWLPNLLCVPSVPDLLRISIHRIVNTKDWTIYKILLLAFLINNFHFKVLIEFILSLNCSIISADLSMFAIWMIFFLLSCLVQFQLSAKDLSMGGSICPINFPKQIGRFWKQGESNEDRDKATCLYSNGENGKD